MSSQEEISCYFNLSQRIKDTKAMLKSEKKNQIITIHTIEKEIEELEFKNKHFKLFLEGLDRNAKSYFLLRYDDQITTLNVSEKGLDILIKEEISEIEEAARYIFKQNDKADILL